MNIQKILKQSLPHIVALALFALISSVLFYPEFQDKGLRQGDVVNYEGMSKDVKDEVRATGEHPNWTGGMFGGMPSVIMLMDSGLTVGSIAKLNSEKSSVWMIFLAMSSFYLMLLMMGVKPYVAMIGGVGYGLSTYFPIIISAGHITKMWALQWAPALLGSIWFTYNRSLWLGAGLSAFFTAMMVETGHHQITYYFLFVIASLVISQGIIYYKKHLIAKFVKTSVVLLFAALLGVGSNIVHLYYTADYSKVSTRGSGSELATEGDSEATSGLDRSYITAWSYGKAETFNLFIPNFEGGGRNFTKGGAVDTELKNYQVPKDYYKAMPSYHGTQPFTEGPVYIGAVIVFLAIFGVCMLKNAQKWWILAPTILAILLSWGHNFEWLTNLFIDHFPLYNKFRVPSMILVVVEWSLPLLAALGIMQLLKGEDKTRSLKALYISGGVAGGFALLSAIILPSVTCNINRVNIRMDFTAASDAQMPETLAFAMQSERADLLSSDGWRALLFVVLSAGVIWCYINRKIKRSAVLSLVLVALVTIDLFGVDRRYISPDDFTARSQTKAIEMTAADQTILQDKDDYRVADFMRGDPFSSSAASYFHRSVGGYHAAKMARYSDIIEHHLSQQNLKVYNMLNTRYFIMQDGEVMENPDAIGSATITDSVIWTEGARAEIAALGAADFNPRRVAVVDSKYKNSVAGADLTTKVDSSDFIELTHYALSELKYQVKVSDPRLIVFSEIYHKDWNVTLDGAEELEIIPVDYVLRGVVVPQGEHTLEFKFELNHYGVLRGVVACSTIAIFVLLALGLFINIRKKNGTSNN
ncbi:MAG: hypothetical protein R3Y49_05220 [Rikenellaceae bacterium]